MPPERFHQDPPGYALLCAWNYEAEIVANEQPFLKGGGKFILPLTPPPAPKVSVVMVTHNRLEHLRGCIQMMLDQTLSDLELIVADDHSADDTEYYVRELTRQDRRVRYHKAEAKGINAALNSATAAEIAKATEKLT